ncbi:MAG: hypothetical protein JSV89_19350 [Spirochaetaceae bacterium]|nr:MAG: hypothetical protein JSV89_19350 [Spirochaetaceae bacterium]
MNSSSYQFELYLLGAPHLERSGQPLHLPRRKALGLLANVAFCKGEIGRETLAALFWPNHDDSQARGSLRRLLSELRRFLGPDLLPTTDDRVGPLEAGKVWIDIEELQSLMARIRLNQRLGAQQARGGLSAGVKAAQTNKELLRRVVELYRGDFLAGFTLGECGQFSDWQFQQGEYLRRELCTALSCLVQLCEQDAEFTEGIVYGRKLVEVDPLNEEAHCPLPPQSADPRQDRRAVSRAKRHLCLPGLGVPLDGAVPNRHHSG